MNRRAHRGWRQAVLSATLALSLCACSTSSYHVYKLYPGPQRDLPEISVVRLDGVQTTRINGLVVARSDWNEVHLPPGEHTIEWGHEFGVSVMVEPSGFARGSRRETITLEPGHIYTLKAARTTGHGYRMYFWIEDDTTGQVVAGTRKP